ncbi:MAG: GMC oxidoreductase [Acidimicrobiales bacterium]
MERFDAAVVGSGFGASAAACRLAQAGRRVLVLERGRAWPPGSFPRSPRGLSQNLWDPPSGLYGMFDVWAFGRMESVVSSGLGGGSLIYANVSLRKDPAWFQEDSPGEPSRPWPVTYDDLEPYYEAAEVMLGVQRYPFATEPYSATPKTRAMQDAASRLGLDWLLPPLAVTFATAGRPAAPGETIVEEHPNLHGAARRTCRLCGECDVGCNDGSKNTLDYNYLSRAKDAGAEIRTLAEVRRIEPASPSGYLVEYRKHDIGRRPGDPPETAEVIADRLVLGAGTFGTTYLLLRNRSAFPALSPALGTRFSGNGDLLTFFRSRARSRARDGGRQPRPFDPELGPVITSAVRMPDSLDGNGEVGRGFYIEDGGNPSFLDWFVQAGSAPSVVARAAEFGARRLAAHLRGRPRSHISRDVSKLFGGGVPSATMIPMLCMGRDVPNGKMSLRHGDLAVDWDASASTAYYDRVERVLSEMACVLGAKLANTPLRLFQKAITVHPVGGVPMGADPSTGVVDALGEVFHYPGLYVVDGSVMPGPVGPNPSLTIAAFAERAAAHMVGAAVR